MPSLQTQTHSSRGILPTILDTGYCLSLHQLFMLCKSTCSRSSLLCCHLMAHSGTQVPPAQLVLRPLALPINHTRYSPHGMLCIPAGHSSPCWPSAGPTLQLCPWEKGFSSLTWESAAEPLCHDCRPQTLQGCAHRPSPGLCKE